MATREMTISPHWVWMALGAIALTALGLWFAFSPRFYVTQIEVIGAQRVPAESIRTASNLLRTHILWADEQAAAQTILEQEPSVERAAVTCHLPADCTVTVVERPPLLTWVAPEGLFWVDGVGGFNPAAQPLASGWEVHGPLPLDANGRVDTRVLVGLAELERLGVSPRAIDYQPGRGLVITDSGGWRVVLGQGTGMEQRLYVYAQVQAYLVEHGIHPRFVDVRFPEAPYYSETNEW
jgi:cell division septal protein FtsQ